MPTPPATRVAALGTVEQGEAVAPVARTPSAAPGGGFDLARLPSSSPNVPSSAQPNAAPDGPPPSPASLEQIFADLGAPSGTAAPVAGAVDIRSIVPAKPEPEVVKPAPVTEAEAKRAETAKTPPTVEKKGKEAAVKGGAGKKAEDGKAASAKAEEAKLAEAKKLDPKKAAAAKKAEAKKAPPSHPSRIWVQIGVGRDKAAIAFDWRKYLRENPAAFKGKQPYISDMGRTNRMLVGPFESQKAAAAYLAQLKKAGVDRGFVWTSPAGQVVDALSAK